MDRMNEKREGCENSIVKARVPFCLIFYDVLHRKHGSRATRGGVILQ